MSEMTLDKVIRVLRDAEMFSDHSGESDLSEACASSIEYLEAHLASQPAEQPRGEPGFFETIWKEATDLGVIDRKAAQFVWHSAMGYARAYAQPKPEQAVGDGVEWISRAALPRVNPAQMVRIAQMYARADTDHAYTKVTDFMPHDWVVAAMCTAYDAGRQNIIDGTHTDGFTPEAIESVRRIFTPRPAVATPADNLGDKLRKLVAEASEYEWSSQFFTMEVIKLVDSMPENTSPAEVTDEMVIRALDAYVHETGTFEVRGAQLVPLDIDGMRAALTAQCQVRKDTQGLDDSERMTPEPLTDGVGESITQKLDKALSDLSNAVEDIGTGKHGPETEYSRGYGDACGDIVAAMRPLLAAAPEVPGHG